METADMPKLERQTDHMQGQAACDLRTSADVQTHSAGCAPSTRKGAVTRPGAIAICVRLLRQHDISFLELATAMSEPSPKAEPKRTPKRGKKGGPPDLLRYTAGDSKVAKPLCDAPIDYSRARVTVAPTPAPRYSVGAGEALTGGFSASRPGMNPLTGKAW